MGRWKPFKSNERWRDIEEDVSIASIIQVDDDVSCR